MSLFRSVLDRASHCAGVNARRPVTMRRARRRQGANYSMDRPLVWPSKDRHCLIADRGQRLTGGAPCLAP